jgi:hypothetical protein
MQIIDFYGPTMTILVVVGITAAMATTIGVWAAIAQIEHLVQWPKVKRHFDDIEHGVIK